MVEVAPVAGAAEVVGGVLVLTDEVQRLEQRRGVGRRYGRLAGQYVFEAASRGGSIDGAGLVAEEQADGGASRVSFILR